MNEMKRIILFGDGAEYTISSPTFVKSMIVLPLPYVLEIMSCAAFGPVHSDIQIQIYLSVNGGDGPDETFLVDNKLLGGADHSIQYNALHWLAKAYRMYDTLRAWKVTVRIDGENALLSAFVRLGTTTLETALRRKNRIDYVKSAEGQLVMFRYVPGRRRGRKYGARKNQRFRRIPTDQPQLRPPLKIYYRLGYSISSLTGEGFDGDILTRSILPQLVSPTAPTTPASTLRFAEAFDPEYLLTRGLGTEKDPGTILKNSILKRVQLSITLNAPAAPAGAHSFTILFGPNRFNRVTFTQLLTSGMWYCGPRRSRIRYFGEYIKTYDEETSPLTQLTTSERQQMETEEEGEDEPGQVLTETDKFLKELPVTILVSTGLAYKVHFLFDLYYRQDPVTDEDEYFARI